jgi:hypothetical protein
MVRLLVQHGADTTIRNDDNKTCLDLCQDEEIANILRTTTTNQATVGPVE